MSDSSRCAAIQNAFDKWSDKTVFNFSHVFDESSADLILYWDSIDGQRSTLANVDAQEGKYYIKYDSSEIWTDDGTCADLESTTLHEIGHILGLAHSPTNVFSVMQVGQEYGIIMRDLQIYECLAIGNLYEYPFYISGPTVPEVETRYTVLRLFEGCTLGTWSYSGVGSLSMFPLNNFCLVSNSNKNYLKGTLTTTVKYQNTVLSTLTKTIDSAGNFSGTYSQDGGQVFSFINGTTYYPPIPTTNFYDGSVIEFHKQLTATISSPLFSSCILARDNGGNFPNSWVQNGNTVTYNPSNHGPGFMSITGTGINSYDVFKFTVTLQPEPLDNIASMGLQQSGESLILSLLNDDGDTSDATTDESSRTDGAVLEQENPIEDYSALVWTVTVMNVQTGAIVFNGKLTGLSPSIPITGWPSGIYAVRADVCGQTLTGKIQIM